MNQSIHIVLDSSGSMVEDSKQHSGIYLLLSLRRFFKEQGIPFTEWQWNTTLSPMGKISSICWTGSLNSSSFYEFSDDSKLILLISDGDFPIDMDFRNKSNCFLLLLGEEDDALQWSFPSGRLWLPEDFNGHLSVLLSCGIGRAVT